MNTRIARMIALLLLFAVLTSCGGEQQSTQTQENADSAAVSQVAQPEDMAKPVEVTDEGLEPVYGEDLLDGVYPIEVESSSTMFRITDCTLTVEKGEMTARMTMGGTGYLYLYPGTAEAAAGADASDYIPFEENADGTHSFTLSVAALNTGMDCAAFSAKKELWYDRTLLFHADSLPQQAFAHSTLTLWETLGLPDGRYTCDVTLSGGSGRASVSSPAQITAENGRCFARIQWSSDQYDYMMAGEERYLPENTEGNSVFVIPVDGFDYPMQVRADTTAMSTPHEIDYTLTFHSDTLQPDT